MTDRFLDEDVRPRGAEVGFDRPDGDVTGSTVAAGALADKAFYDEEPVGSEDDHRRFMAEIATYFDAYAARLAGDLRGGGGVVVELGAGSCGLSTCVSRLAEAKAISSVDISAIRMNKMLDLSVAVLKGDRPKITAVPADFNQRLPFADGSVDAILFDAALHHARSMWNILAECRRILRPGGVLVAQRESYLNPLRAGRQLRHLLRSPEVAAQVSENMYLREQYEYYLKVNGFAVDFIPASASAAKRKLKALNGRAFTDGVLYCRKAA